MKKIILSILALTLLVGAFCLGKYHGERAVVLSQEIWEEDGFFYSNYKGEVNYYGKTLHD